MVAYVGGNAGGPPPPTEREAVLAAELRDCRARLHAAQERAERLLTMATALAIAYEKLAKEPTQ